MGTLYSGRHRHVEPENSQPVSTHRRTTSIVRRVGLPTLWDADHEGVEPLAGASALGVRTLCERAAGLGDLHHHAVEVLAFGRAMAADAWFATDISCVFSKKVMQTDRVQMPTTTIWRLLHRGAFFRTAPRNGAEIDALHLHAR